MCFLLQTRFLTQNLLVDLVVEMTQTDGDPEFEISHCLGKGRMTNFSEVSGQMVPGRKFQLRPTQKCKISLQRKVKPAIKKFCFHYQL